MIPKIYVGLTKIYSWAINIYIGSAICRIECDHMSTRQHDGAQGARLAQAQKVQETARQRGSQAYRRHGKAHWSPRIYIACYEEQYLEMQLRKKCTNREVHLQLRREVERQDAQADTRRRRTS